MITLTYWQFIGLAYLFAATVLFTWHYVQVAAGEVQRDNIVFGFIMTVCWPLVFLTFVYAMLITLIQALWRLTMRIWKGWA